MEAASFFAFETRSTALGVTGKKDIANSRFPASNPSTALRTKDSSQRS